MMDINNIDSVLAVFESSAEKHAVASEKGDSKTANKNFDKMIGVVNLLKAHNKIDYLHKFMNHSTESVRLAAATYLLATYENEAIKVIEEIKESGSFQSFLAEVTLDEWRKGRLKV